MENKTTAPQAKRESATFSARQSGDGLARQGELALTGDQVARAVTAPSRLLPGDVLMLQRTIGNHAVAQLLQRQSPDPTRQVPTRQSPLFQPKLTVGPAHDGYEVEADQIANQIVRSAASSHGKQQAQAGAVQRAPTVRRLQRNAPVGLEGGAVDAQLEGSLRRAQNGGSSLPTGVRRTLEPKLGANLSTVKVHTGSHAAQLSRELGAKAFTHKNHIFYGAGQSPSDVRLTAHEAVHTIQQGAVQQAPIQRNARRERKEDRAELVDGQPHAQIIQRAKDKVTFNGKTTSVEKNNKPALKDAITKLSTEGVEPVSSEATPEAVLLMGASGSGKSSIIDDVVPDRSSFVHADPDAVKSAMPAYQKGIKAGNKDIASTVHAESKDITKSIVDNTITTRRNLLYDGTGGNLQEYDNMITALHRSSYHVKLVMTHISVDEGLKRVAERAVVTGRAIPDSVVKDMYQWVPRNFPILAQKADQAYLYDNMVPRGQAPKLVWEKGDGTKLKDEEIVALKDLLASIASKKIDQVVPEVTPPEEVAEERTPFTLKGTLSKKAKFKGFFGKVSTFAKLQAELANYHRADGPAEKLASLTILKDLATHWLDAHGTEKNKDVVKETSIKGLLEDIKTETPLLNQQIKADADEQDEYIRQIEAKSLKYMTQSGHMIAKKMKGWHAGTDTMGDQAVAVRELTQKYGLTLAEASAIGIYTADDYKYMNPAVANNRGWMTAMLPRVGFSNLTTARSVQTGVTDTHIDEAVLEGKLHGKIAKAGMKKLPNWTGSVYRGLGLTEEEFAAQYPLGGTSVLPAFSSTSTKEGVSKGFARKEATGGKVGVLLVLQVNKGKDIATLSNSPGEGEILLMPGATFVVSKIKNEDYKGTKLYVVTLKQQK